MFFLAGNIGYTWKMSSQLYINVYNIIIKRKNNNNKKGMYNASPGSKKKKLQIKPSKVKHEMSKPTHPWNTLRLL